ncbi:hypothetical protein HY949_02610 [Candidatus Gottesmanbacteria bacterium]|nr:hypothetical protein [Candidatus Gottesmanbacteria bacterium]
MDKSRAHHVLQSCAYRLVLIDGNAILHRAYHALPPLTAPDGSVVNAVYGFVSILIKLFQDLKPTHMAVAFDRPEKTFRKSLYKDYQGKRPEMDKELVSQIEPVHEIIRCFGIPIFELGGYEADDLLGTIARKVHDEHLIVKTHDEHTMEKSRANHVSLSSAHQSPEVIIVTGDKDILQLVDDARRVKVFMPTKGLSEGKLYGEAEVIERLGVTPKQIPEFKALMGDSSDNYPGVAGIGPKTAVGIIGSFGSIEKMYHAIKESNQESLRQSSGQAGIRNQGKKKLLFSTTVLEKLRNGEEMARMSKDLATIRTDVPIEFKSLETIETLDTSDAREKLSELHFPSLLKRLTGIDDGKSERPSFAGASAFVKTLADAPADEAGEQQELF